MPAPLHAPMMPGEEPLPPMNGPGPIEPPLPGQDSRFYGDLYGDETVGMTQQDLDAGVGTPPAAPVALPQQAIDLPDPPTPEEWKAMQAPERAADRAYTLAVRDLITTAAATGMSQKAVSDALVFLQAKRMEAQIRAAPGSINSVTNRATGEVFNVYSHPAEGSRIIDPKIIQSQDGTRAIWGGTNSVLIRDKDSKAPTMGYMAEPAEEGDTPKFGQTNATTVTPTNAPTPPAFDPTTLTNAAMIRDALHSGKIPDEQTALQLIKSLGSR